MINVKHAAKHLGKNIQVQSPTILSAVAVVGVAGTAYFTFKAAFTAGRSVQGFENVANVAEEANFEVDKLEVAKVIWKDFLPAIAVGSLTVGCIVASNRIQARRLAALAGAYALLSGDFDEYKDKAREILGTKKSSELDQARAKRSIDNMPAPKDGLLLPEGKSWFLDKTTGRPIITTMETIKAVQNELNYTIINHGDASLNDFYAQLGMDPVRIGDILGWNRKHKVEISFTPILTEDRGAVTAFEFIRGPLPDFYKYKGKVDPDEIGDLGA